MTTSGEPWQAWFDRYAPALVLYARQFVHRRADAEDVVQDAFLRFWRRRSSVDDAKAYLFACVRSAALDQLRRKRRQHTREQQAARELPEPWLAGEPELEERRASVEQAVQALPEPQREVLILKIWGQLTFADIAGALGVSPNTAASRYRYALARLREVLRSENVV